MENTNILNLQSDDIDIVSQFAKEMADENEDISHLREIMDTNSPIQGLTSAEKAFNLDENGKPIFVKEASELKESDLDIMTTIDGGIDLENDKIFKQSFNENSRDTYGLNDEEAAQVLDCILSYKKDKKFNVYSHLPSKLRIFVNQICAQNQLSPSMRNTIAKDLIAQFISEAATDTTFIDFEKSLEKAMKIPSLTDVYNEYLNETMDKKLPAMADAIEATDPDKAHMLRSIAKRFSWAVTYSEIISQYEENARIRKSVRKEYENYNKFATELNYANKNTQFKMADATVIYDVIKRVVIDEDEELTDVDAMKFVTLLCRAVENRKNDDVVDASYIYYLLKNIIMISYSNEQAKSSFSSELISNIKIVMYYVREKESEFNEEHSSTGDKSKSRKSSNRKK